MANNYSACKLVLHKIGIERDRSEGNKSSELLTISFYGARKLICEKLLNVRFCLSSC